MKPFEPSATVRRTLPAPSEPLDVGAVLAERDRLRFEVASLHAEINRLRLELTKYDGASVPALVPSMDELDFDAHLPPPSPLPAMVMITGGLQANAPTQDRSPRAPTGEARPFTPGSHTSAPSSGIDFGTVSRLSPNELDALPYGLICVDAQGRVVHYNDTESRMARLPKGKVIGRNFFTDVAPCTRVREFEGKFYELVRDPSKVRVCSFDFVFRFHHSEQHVTIVMTPARTRGLYNFALLRRSVSPKE